MSMTLTEPASRTPARTPGQATLVEQSRAIAEVQAAVVVAQNRPRSAAAAMQEMREVCRIPALADRAFFRFNRGGGNVTGETVHLARELARIWGNITFGIAEMARDDVKGQSEMLAFAWDLQTNARSQTTFIVPHVRDTKQGPKAMTDMRDIYENNANMGARRLREMIFAVLPVWFREEAADLCRDTLEHGGGKPMVQRIADCLAALESIGVTRAQIEAKIGCSADAMLPEHVASLGVVFKSIRRGEATKADEFPAPAAKPPMPPGGKLDALEQAIAPQPEPPEQPTAPAEPPVIQQEQTPEPGYSQADLDHITEQPLPGRTGPGPQPDDQPLKAAKVWASKLHRAADEDALHEIMRDKQLADDRRYYKEHRPELDVMIAEASGAAYERLTKERV